MNKFEARWGGKSKGGNKSPKFVTQENALSFINLNDFGGHIGYRDQIRDQIYE